MSGTAVQRCCQRVFRRNQEAFALCWTCGNTALCSKLMQASVLETIDHSWKAFCAETHLALCSQACAPWRVATLVSSWSLLCAIADTNRATCTSWTQLSSVVCHQRLSLTRLWSYVAGVQQCAADQQKGLEQVPPSLGQQPAPHQQQSSALASAQPSLVLAPACSAESSPPQLAGLAMPIKLLISEEPFDDVARSTALDALAVSTQGRRLQPNDKGAASARADRVPSQFRGPGTTA